MLTTGCDAYCDGDAQAARESCKGSSQPDHGAFPEEDCGDSQLPSSELHVSTPVLEYGTLDRQVHRRGPAEYRDEEQGYRQRCEQAVQ